MISSRMLCLHRCIRLCFLGLGADAFRASPTLARRSNHFFRSGRSSAGLVAAGHSRNSFASASTSPYVDKLRAASTAEGTDDSITSEGAILSQRENSPDPNDEAEDEPRCRVVATSDGKIPPLPAVASLSPSSRTLLQKIELLYSVESQKELNGLNYMLPRSAGGESYRDESSFEAMEDSGNGQVTGASKEDDLSSSDQEREMISLLKRSLDDGGFKLMQQRDLDLCSALNAGYLLRLSLLPDTKDLDCIGEEFYPELYQPVNGDDGGKFGSKTAAKSGKDPIPNNNLLFDGRVLVFRRGYSKEITTGRLLLPKLDYLQASLVQRSSASLTRKLGALERRLEGFVLDLVASINTAVQRFIHDVQQSCRSFVMDVLDNFGLTKNEIVAGLIAKRMQNQTEGFLDDMDNATETKGSISSYNVRGNRIFKLGRYQTSPSSIIPTSLDLNDALSQFLLCEVGYNTTNSGVEQDIYDGMNAGNIMCQYDETLLAMSNGTNAGQAPVGSTYTPTAVSLLERVSVQDTVDFFSKKGRRELIRNFFKASTLVEPAYEEVIVIWRPMRRKKPRTIQQIYPPKWLYEVAKVFDMEERLPARKNSTQYDDQDDGSVPLEIKAFKNVPMANIEAVLPKNKLVFRPADAIVFDLISLVSFLAVAGSLKFDSPKLDLIALISLGLFAIRTFFRYSNKYARYDLLVNKFLTSKISHRGAGALKYIVSEANTNKALRALLIRDWLSTDDSTVEYPLNTQVLDCGKVYINDRISADATQIDVDVERAIADLKHLSLLREHGVTDDAEANDALRKVWNAAFD